MAKRLASLILLAIGVALACAVILLVVMFMAPGLSIFGIKYIATNTHVVSKVSAVTDEIGSFSGSFRVEVEDVPVYVVFTQGYSYQVDYYDNYSGLTASKLEDPYIEFSKDSDGTAVIKVTSFKTLGFENANSKRHVKILIPSNQVSSGTTNLKIVSKNSKVHFEEEREDYYDPYFNNIEIETAGKITSSVQVTAKNFILKTLNTINITDSAIESINATNYYLTSTGGKIVVDRDVSGDIVAKTNNARIQIMSCQNFTADAGFGDVYCARKGAEVTIFGKADIKTTAGVVDLGSILGTSSKSTIATKTGNVRIKKAYDLDISTTRGFVRVASARNLNVTTSSGSITVEEATASVKAVSKRGKIYLGGESNVLCNPTVESTYGKVFIYSASGTVKASTVKADMEFTNRDATKATLNVGGNLIAKNLLGAVSIEVDGNATIDFANFTQASTITGKKAKSLMTINLLANETNTLSYNFEGNDVTLLEYNTDDPSNNYQIDKSTNIVSGAASAGRPLLTVKNPGQVVVYCKKS